MGRVPAGQVPTGNAIPTPAFKGQDASHPAPRTLIALAATRASAERTAPAL
jgi:hypothetical protein